MYAHIEVLQIFGHNSAPLRARDLGTSKNKVLEGEEFDFEVKNEEIWRPEAKDWENYPQKFRRNKSYF